MNLQAFTWLVNEHFLKPYDTLLVGGFEEPMYMPAVNNQAAEIRFTRDYFSSALHEMAHWCIAGFERRKKIDYGYWYAPDGRTQQQQLAFYQYETKPQAIEKALSIACGINFCVSVDNLNNDVKGELAFCNSVLAQHQEFVNHGFPERANILLLKFRSSN